jgi:hypothetical protein
MHSELRACGCAQQNKPTRSPANPYASSGQIGLVAVHQSINLRCANLPPGSATEPVLLVDPSAGCQGLVF